MAAGAAVAAAKGIGEVEVRVADGVGQLVGLDGRVKKGEVVEGHAVGDGGISSNNVGGVGS